MKAVLLVLALTSAASAQVSDIEVPMIVLDTGEGAAGPSADESLDLANIVQSAAKGVTTVQEAPAIVTVITADEIRERMFQDLGQVVDTVPGWQRIGLAHSVFPTPIVRGQVQAVQFLHDSVSMFDPMANVPAIHRGHPMEIIKRIEMITGPGGVLWGSNSLLGIMNVITKDAEDVEGVEVGGSIGHAPGDRLMARAYAMGGKSDFFKGKLKLFGHGSVETYQGAEYKMPLLLFHDALPQPNSSNTYGPLTQGEQRQSLIVTLDGKATLGKLQLRAQFPFGQMYRAMGLSGNPVVRDLVEDSRCENNGVVDPTCVDNLRTTREERTDGFDRYAVLEYRDRFANGKAGLTLRGYAIQFVRNLIPLQVLAPSQAIQGGLAFNTDLSSYRAGMSFDGDIEIAKPFRVLYGAEAFNEWHQTDTDRSRQGAGSQSVFPAPYDLTRLPLPCPRIYDQAQMKIVPIPECPLTFAYEADRTVLGAYANPQVRPNKKLILDAGARVQVAPASLGSVDYPVNFTYAGAIVYQFIPNWHIKLNYTQGFRPPVFNNTSSNGEAVQITGDPDLEVERSEAYQAEINARIWKGERRIRELSFRIDGSYTRLENLIQVNRGGYANTADRGLSSVEFLGKLYIQGGHRIELAYTWLRGDTGDRGRLRSLPEHWFHLTTIFSIVTDKLVGTTNLKVVGASEDPNRIVEYRDSTYDEMGYPVNPVIVAATDLVMDRLPPQADLSFGVTWTPVAKLMVRATVFNALMQHQYQPDAFFDYEPHLEYLPNPYEGIRAYVSALYQY